MVVPSRDGQDANRHEINAQFVRLLSRRVDPWLAILAGDQDELAAVHESIERRRMRTA
ncbi:hypothetical protein [Bradyrhizobium ganzhouense]|uniref:hypothetical protein n=1 Tax=Bradyrhizobium ganzhouense TaxID=1179767 RepID=UPI003CEEC612